MAAFKNRILTVFFIFINFSLVFCVQLHSNSTHSLTHFTRVRNVTIKVDKLFNDLRLKAFPKINKTTACCMKCRLDQTCSIAIVSPEKGCSTFKSSAIEFLESKNETTEEVFLKYSDISGQFYKSNLLSFWPMSLSTKDIVGNTTMTVVQKGSFAADRYGESNSALFLDGGSATISQFSSRSGFSVMFWTRFGDPNTKSALIECLNGNALNIGVYLDPDAVIPGTPEIKVCLSEDANCSQEASYNISNGKGAENQWFHVALTVDPVYTRLFVNGTKVNQIRTTNLLRNTAVACQIGSSRFSLPALQGYIDELKIFYEPIDQYSIDIQKDMKAKDIEKKWLRKFVPTSGTNINGTKYWWYWPMSNPYEQQSLPKFRIGDFYPTTDRFGNQKSAMALANKEYKLESASTYYFKPGFEFSIMFWLKLSSIDSSKDLHILRYSDKLRESDFTIKVEPVETSLELIYYKSDGNASFHFPTNYTLDDVWTFATFIQSTNSLSFYANGELTNSIENSINSYDNGLKNGLSNFIGSSGIRGAIDELKFVHKAISQSQIVFEMDRLQPREDQLFA